MYSYIIFLLTYFIFLLILFVNIDVVLYFCQTFFGLISSLAHEFPHLDGTPFHESLNVSGEGVNTTSGVVYLTPL